MHPQPTAAVRGGAALVTLLALAGLWATGCRDGRLDRELLEAAQAGDAARVQALVAQGASVMFQDRSGQTSLILAACGGHADVVRVVVGAVAPWPRGEAVAYLDHESPRLRRTYITALECAAREGHDDVITALLDAGARVGGPGRPLYRTPLIWAAGAGHLGTVRLLLARGADPNEGISDINDLTALMVAARSGYVAVVEELIRAGANLEAYDSDGTALIQAAQYGRSGLGDEAKQDPLGVVRVLVEAGAHLEAADFHQWTALYHAAHLGKGPIVRYLLEAGADPHGAPKPYGGDTPLTAAALRGDIEIVDLLLQAGVRAGSDEGTRALVLAASYGQLEMVKRLLGAGADIDARPSTGYARSSALGACASAGHIPCVRFLLEAGARVEPQDIQALETTGDPRIIRLLQEAQGS